MNDNMRMPPAGSQVGVAGRGRVWRAWHSTAVESIRSWPLQRRGPAGPPATSHTSRVAALPPAGGYMPAGLLQQPLHAPPHPPARSLAPLLLQTEAEIRSVVQEAQKSSAMNPAGWEVRRRGVGGGRCRSCSTRLPAFRPARLPVCALLASVPQVRPRQLGCCHPASGGPAIPFALIILAVSCIAALRAVAGQRNGCSL